MPRESNRDIQARVLAVAHGLSKAGPSNAISNPADDLQDPTTVNDVAMRGGVICCADGRALLTYHWGALEDAAQSPHSPDNQYCNFCGNRAQVLRDCSSCKAVVCEQPRVLAQGCIPFHAGKRDGFLCPYCARLKLVKNVSGVTWC